MSTPAFIGWILLAFTAGLVLHPLVAATVRWVYDKMHDRKIQKASVLLTDAGWTVLHPDHTQPQLGLVDTGRDDRPSSPANDPLAGWGFV